MSPTSRQLAVLVAATALCSCDAILGIDKLEFVPGQYADTGTDADSDADSDSDTDSDTDSDADADTDTDTDTGTNSDTSSGGDSDSESATDTGAICGDEVCLDGETCCDDTYCADLNTDSTNCGGCGHDCTATDLPEGDGCDLGTCTCHDGSGCAGTAASACCESSGACTDTNWDDDNCGTCGWECGSSFYCDAGWCT